ncbi:hypothetical protein O6H91_10G072900 [Diphasiastrum complanatum]|uniref:Uncharacterized protein n=1 Tax=Diphasiastrum complanatum TaxID=34168 RepID=A0ACC2CIG3_DIPCM|nr:hypothetical protein O6H91_10G072900 [Diphasiastrum complanatum]
MKRVLVTGASSGVGQAVALKFAGDGHGLYITGRDAARLSQTADICLGAGAKVVQKGIGDVSEENDVARHYSEALHALGGIDIAVLNAGVGRHGLLEDMSIENFDLVFNTNVRGVFLWLKKILPHMKERKSGQIIVISSVAGVQAFAGKSVYCASKFAVQGLVESLRAELSGTGVKAATILPGVIATPWWEGPAGNHKGVQAPALTADDIAANVAFIAYQSEKSDIDKVVVWPA